MELIKLFLQMLALSIFDGDTGLLGNGSNAVVTLTLSARPSKRWNIGKVTVGYSAAPTGGLLTVNEGGNPIFVVPISAAGPTAVAISRRGAAGNPMTISLSAGGSGIVGYVNVEAVAL
jgi:hypothetical protein